MSNGGHVGTSDDVVAEANFAFLDFLNNYSPEAVLEHFGWTAEDKFWPIVRDSRDIVYAYWDLGLIEKDDNDASDNRGQTKEP